MEPITKEFSGPISEPLSLKAAIVVTIALACPIACLQWYFEKPIMLNGYMAMNAGYCLTRWLYQKYRPSAHYLTIRGNEIDYRDPWGRLKTLDMKTATGIAWCGDNIGVRTESGVISVDIKFLQESEQTEVSEYVRQFIARNVGAAAVV